MRKATTQEIKTAAIYKFTAKRRMPRAEIEALLVSRAGLPERAASLLAGHWITTQYYRHGYRFTA
jgi:hypothetical protein